MPDLLKCRKENNHLSLPESAPDEFIHPGYSRVMNLPALLTVGLPLEPCVATDPRGIPPTSAIGMRFQVRHGVDKTMTKCRYEVFRQKPIPEGKLCNNGRCEVAFETRDWGMAEPVGGIEMQVR